MCWNSTVIVQSSHVQVKVPLWVSMTSCCFYCCYCCCWQANLLVSHVIGASGDWLLHSNQGENLEEMVLHDITKQGAETVTKTADRNGEPLLRQLVVKRRALTG